jgi:hypothetical protein
MTRLVPAPIVTGEAVPVDPTQFQGPWKTWSFRPVVPFAVEPADFNTDVEVPLTLDLAGFGGSLFMVGNIIEVGTAYTQHVVGYVDATVTCDSGSGQRQAVGDLKLQYRIDNVSAWVNIGSVPFDVQEVEPDFVAAQGVAENILVVGSQFRMVLNGSVAGNPDTNFELLAGELTLRLEGSPT